MNVLESWLEDLLQRGDINLSIYEERYNGPVTFTLVVDGLEYTDDTLLGVVQLAVECPDDGEKIDG